MPHDIAVSTNLVQKNSIGRPIQNLAQTLLQGPILLIFGIGAALTSMVGLNMGAGNLKRAQRVGWTGAYAAGLLTGLIGLVVAVQPKL